MGRRSDFENNRRRLNKIVLDQDHLGIKRYFNLDSAAYRDGALSAKTKELLGLVASLVLRCDDCITYHVIACYQAGFTPEELNEALNVGLVVGGSITIPHLRRAYELLDELKPKRQKPPKTKEKK